MLRVMPARRTAALLVLTVSLACAAIFLSPPSAQTGPRLLHSEPSPFGAVLVFEEGGQRCLNFNSMSDYGRQTCMSLQHPDTLLFSYTRMMVSALLVKPDPESILIVGLGGATLQKALARLLPDAAIDTVEIDPAVGKVAREYFGYRQGPTQRLFVEDGRAHVERARREGRRYDMIMLDAFDVDYIPRHLMTAEFLTQVKDILTPDGIVVANTFTSSELYERESATYAAVFGEFFNMRGSNRVIVAGKGVLPDNARVSRRADEWEPRLAPLGIQKLQALRWLSERRPGGAGAAAILTDDENGSSPGPDPAAKAE